MPISRFTIERLGPLGDGIAETPQGPVFIDRALPQDELRASVAKDHANVSRGEITEILTPSPYRQKASCPHYDDCGNCSLQHATTEFYRNWKVETVRQTLQRVGLTPSQWLEPLFLSSGKRRRASFSLQKKKGKGVMGYYRRRSQEITDIENCEIIHPELLDLKKWLKPFLSPLLKDGESLDIFFQKIGNSIDMVISEPNPGFKKKDFSLEQLLTDVLETSPINRISFKTEKGFRTVYKEGKIEAEFGPLKVELPPGAFLQPTEEGEKGLVEAVLSALPSSGTFADLFSGCGTFSGPLLTRGTVHSYESNELAVKSLSKAAQKHPLKVFQRDLFKNPLKREELNQYDAVLFDPPRSGCNEQAKEMAASQVPLLIGISCNPASFAKDVRLLVNGGYRIQSIQVVDQFIYSHHVEVVGIFTKKL